jgi:activator of HSP90 ATPase
MVLHNPNNWHWVNKDVSLWAKEFLEKELTGLAAEQGGVTATVDKVLSMDGDVDVSQRKGKVITLFDVKLKLEYSGESCLRLCRSRVSCASSRGPLQFAHWNMAECQIRQKQRW